ncbi:MAG: hypothetical protein ACTSPI_13560 [Candidatus Heimdallarchaeaceae archaeon]
MVKKQIERIQKEIPNKEFKIEYAELMLTKGLEQNYLEKRREFEFMKRQQQEELHMINKQIEILDKQIKEGVEVKEETKQEEPQNGR